jgi:uncharacterized protein (DUF433 family)
MRSRISIDPEICHGKPVIRRTRVLVSNVLADLAAGRTFQQIIKSYPNITVQDIKAALSFGSDLAKFEGIPYEAAV